MSVLTVVAILAMVGRLTSSDVTVRCAMPGARRCGPGLVGLSEARLGAWLRWWLLVGEVSRVLMA